MEARRDNFTKCFTLLTPLVGGSRHHEQQQLSSPPLPPISILLLRGRGRKKSDHNKMSLFATKLISAFH